MMPRGIGTVAAWEFRRYFKWKEQVWGVLIALLIALGYHGARAAFGAKKEDAAPVYVAIAQDDPPMIASGEVGRFRLRAEVVDVAEERRRIAAGELGALVILRSEREGEIVTREREAWRAELEATIQRLLAAHTLERLAVPPEALAALASPAEFTASETGKDAEAAGAEIGAPAEARRRSRTERVTVGVFVGLMLFGVFVGNAYVFVGITGEKASRMTEQIVSAVPAQSWIDGKIVGLACLSLVQMVNGAVGIAVFVGVGWFFGSRVTIPLELVLTPAMALSALFCAMGFVFWFAFFAAIAATIDNPYNSGRAAFLYLPVAALAPAFFAFGTPNAAWAVALGWFPPTAPAMMPLRMVIGAPAWWEVAGSLLLLAAAIHLVRRAAGKIFRLGMLIHGKEPGFREMARWVMRA